MTLAKRALVTGASEGIGRAFAARLARDGYRVTAVARSEGRLAELISALGEGHTYLVADLSEAAGLERVRTELSREHYDLLINNAGFGHYGAFVDADATLLQSMMRLNIEALVLLAHTFLRHARSGDALLNVSSVLAFLPMPQLSVYGATKAFVTSFSESLWAEQKGRGVFVLGFCPGATTTEFHSRAGGSLQHKQAPDFMMQSAEDVVQEALQALRRHNQPTVVSGAINRLTSVLRYLPRKQLVNLLGSASSH